MSAEEIDNTLLGALTRISGQLGGISARLGALEQHGAGYSARLNAHADRLAALERAQDRETGAEATIDQLDAAKIRRRQTFIGAAAAVAAIASTVTAFVHG